jgi:hypothetical protein
VTFFVFGAQNGLTTSTTKTYLDESFYYSRPVATLLSASGLVNSSFCLAVVRSWKNCSARLLWLSAYLRSGKNPQTIRSCLRLLRSILAPISALLQQHSRCSRFYGSLPLAADRVCCTSMQHTDLVVMMSGFEQTVGSLMPVPQHMHIICQSLTAIRYRCHQNSSMTPYMPACVGLQKLQHTAFMGRNNCVMMLFSRAFQVPVLTRDTADHVPVNGLVRFRGMVSTMFNTSSNSNVRKQATPQRTCEQIAVAPQAGSPAAVVESTLLHHSCADKHCVAPPLPLPPTFQVVDMYKPEFLLGP